MNINILLTDMAIFCVFRPLSILLYFGVDTLTLNPVHLPIKFIKHYTKYSFSIVIYIFFDNEFAIRASLLTNNNPYKCSYIATSYC